MKLDSSKSRFKILYILVLEIIICDLMTLKLYLQDSYIKTFKAKVLSISKTDDLYSLILDRTAFYPLSGGQDHDAGFIKGLNGLFRVLCVNELNDDRIIHIGNLEGNIVIDDEVEGSIDWNRRYRLMRMHTAAHILIQAVKSYFNENVKCVSASKSVHGGHLDFAALIHRDMLKDIENIANKVIREDKLIIVQYMNFDKAEKYVSNYGESLNLYLRKGSINEPIRIVEVKDWIAIPCGGTHVKSTGEIGFINLLKRESKGKGIVRIYYDVKP
ncbi:MAG: alanyl-tRNA editing protein [Candidatus Methanomethylicia archaeon]|nr:alanyl-tRNA editing protein [Candidatus Methanomethylicia archaeon]